MSGSTQEDLQVTIPEGTRYGRADKVLASVYPDLSRSRWQKLFADGRVWLDDRVLSQKSKVRAGDVIDFSIPSVVPLELRPVEMPLSILHEDEYILVIDKEPGRVVHPGAGTGEDTLVHGILHHCRGSLSGIGGTERPGIVHRLDKETSGVLIVAKNDEAFLSLSEQFSERRIRKFYTALIRGVPDPLEGSIDEPICRHPFHRVRMACRPEGREALTDYAIQRKWGTASLAWVRIHTGRTHQIRVHFKHIGHPLLGDTVYGFKQTDALPPVARVMLHASRLEFTHPASGEELVIEAPLPEDFRQLMDALDHRHPADESH